LNWFSVVLFIAVITGCNTVDAPVLGGTVKDIDGNVYHTVTIGTQTWMIENLKTTHYSDSTAIPMVTDSAAWTKLKTPGYCWYNNDSTSNKTVFGALYNWYAVNTNKLAPVGWHIPTDAEWTKLENNVSGYLYDSGSLAKILAATTNWLNSTVTGAIGNNLLVNNSSGFSAMPGGLRGDLTHSFSSIDSTAAIWNSTKVSDTTALGFLMTNDMSSVDRYNKPKWNGLSVRCIKDAN
jgi:uncharacterized protein (TIGR02145 family)